MKKLIAGNWKMNNNAEESISLIKSLKTKLKNIHDVEVAVCPSFVCLSDAARELKGSTIELGAQNLYFEEKGAFTGEVSPLMLKGICKYAIIGHSERRNIFRETDELINKKLISALEHNLIPIFCIGEKLDEREKGIEKNIVQNQLKKGLEGIGKYKIAKIVIAYEPVWAIGTGKNATPEQAQEMHAFIRSMLKKNYGSDIASQIRILYGGSVKPDNIEGLIRQKDIDGALVGGASLDAEGFAKIIRISSNFSRNIFG